ncbi:MAG TPA: hypothetical protein VGL00_22165 [Terracidiphilus sp.]|jgi:hypothetical protein
MALLPRASGKPNRQATREILSYFLRNPEATDSLMGIARWRLLHEVVHRSVTETEAGLKWLVKEGYLRELSVEGSEHLFQLDPAKHKEAQSFLETGSRARSRKVKRTTGAGTTR